MIYSIVKEKTALLIIDAQREYSVSDRPLFVSDFKETTEKINMISASFREKGIPVFIVKHEHDSSGLDVGRMGDFSPDEVFLQGSEFSQLDDSLEVSETDIVVAKTRYSAFVNTKLESYLRTLEIDTLVITGYMTGYCCVTTARHAHDLDYKVLYIDDATSGPAFGDLGFGDVSIDEIKKVVATLLAGGVAEVISSEDVLQRIE